MKSTEGAEKMSRRKRKKRKQGEPKNGASNGSNGHAVASPLEAPAADVAVEPSTEASPEASPGSPPEVPPEAPREAPPEEEAPQAESSEADDAPFVNPFDPMVVEAPPIPVEVSMAEMVSSMAAAAVMHVDHAPNAVGWTAETTKEFKRSKEIYELGKEIDREVAHLVMGIIAIHLGDFDIVALNFQSCGIAPQTTFQQQQPGRNR